MKRICIVCSVLLGCFAARPLRADDGVTWPGLVADAPLQKEKWPAARTLVWARPGTSGSASTPGNWVEYASSAEYLAAAEGRPATTPPDANTDLVLPDAPQGQSYIAGFFNTGRRRVPEHEPPGLYCRHIRIGKGAGLDGGCGSSRGRSVFSSHPGLDAALEIHGNVTVKEDGYLYGQLLFAGGKHTYLLVENSQEPLATRIVVRKSGDAGVTLLARRYDLLQGVTLASGRLSLGPATHLRFGAGRDARAGLGKMPENRMQEIAKADIKESYVYVCPDAVLEMQAGSRIGRVKVPENLVADLRIEGLLQIGRPSGGNGEPAVIELGMAEGDGGFLRQHGGLYVRRTAQIKNFGTLSVTAYNAAAAAKADHGVSVYLERTVDFGDVSFDYLRAGGIAALDPEAAEKALSDATFGEHCAARGPALFSKLDLIAFQGGLGTVEFVDGLQTDCRILFPHAGRLMVRSKGNRTVQSFDLNTVHAVTIDGRRTQFSARRPLNDQEQELRNVNALWADVPGKGQVGHYADVHWDPAPLLIWARPGESGSRFVGPNWLDEHGVPRFDSPLDLDADVDILLPAAETYYAVMGFGSGGMARPVPARHVTVEYNATYGRSYNIRGNLWMKHGSGLKGRQLGSFINTEPGVHRFLRFDGKRIRESNRDEEPFSDGEDYNIAQWGNYQAGPGGTLELIGKIRASADHARVEGQGTVIISENGFLTDGNRSAFAIMPEATVVLLQDARIGHETIVQEEVCKASVWVAGTLMIGLPERPITRDMLFPVAGVVQDRISRTPGEHLRTAGVSFMVGRQGRLVIHSADPTKARVIFKMHDSEKAKRKATERGRNWGQPDGIVMYFAGDTPLNGVVFDNVYENGIMVPSAVRRTWNNVFFGEHNLAEPEKLYWDLKLADVP